MTAIPTRSSALLWRTCAWLILACTAAAPAAAQNAANGKLLYNTRYGTQNQGCYSCHGVQGSTLSNISKIRNGVNNPTLIQSAINNNVGGMQYLAAYLSSAQVIDIAAYLGNPGLVGLSTAVASLSSSSLAFASVNLGSSSAAQSVTLSNTGTGALTLTSLASSTSFKVTGGTCAAGGAVAAGGSCTVTLTFSPLSAGSLSGSLSLVHSAGTSTVALSGTGVSLSPSAAASPTSLSFSQAVGSSSATQAVTLSNTGTAALTVSSLSLSGTAAGDFAIASGGTCSAAGSVAVGSSCTVLLSFAPTVAGARSAALAIAHNAVGSPTSITLSGTATALPQATVALNASSLAFGAQTILTTGAAQTLSLSNTGSAALVLSSLSLAGSNAADFKLAGTCAANASIAAGGSCTLLVSFTPQALGSRSATVTVASNASNGSAVIALGGTGAAVPVPAVSLSPATLDFGALTVGAAAGSRTVTLSNSGSAALNLSGIAVSGNGFSGSNDCGATLAAGSSCSLTLAFAPSGVAAYSGLASISSNAAGSPHTVALSGSGVLAPLPVLAWQGAAPSGFGEIAVGSRSAPQAFTLLNQGPGAVTLTSVAVQGGSVGEFVLGGSCASGAALALNASCSGTVIFAPAVAGSRSASLNVLSTGSNPVALALTGTGAATAQAALSLSASSVALPALTAGATSTTVPLTLTNSGNTTVTLKALSLSNTQFSTVVVCGTLPLALAPGQSCEVDVSVSLAAAASAGALSASLTVSTDVASLTPTVVLTGVVNAAVAVVTATPAAGGGCSLARPGAPFDPVLWLMCGLAGAVLWLRRRSSGNSKSNNSSTQP